MSDELLWRLTSPRLAAACIVGAVAFAGWLIVQHVERQLDLLAGDAE